MKLLVFAHRPPPHHGQSAMVATLLDGLACDPDIEVLHVDARLSRDAADVGRWRPGKLVALFAAVARAWRLRLRHGDAAFYYIPAPGKRSALYRDFLVLLLCRPLFSRLVLHWHAVGLGAWLTTHASAVERALARRLLGHADLALVLAPELADDARAFSPRQVASVPNSVPDPGAALPRARNHPSPRHEILYLALCTRTKGLFDTVEAVALAHARAPGTVRLTVAGTFPDPAEAEAFQQRAAELGPEVVRHLGFVDGAAKHAAFAAADVFCFPTSYAHEGQPLVLVEALAHDLPIVTTRWRAIPGMLPAGHIRFVAPHAPAALAAALLAAAHAPPPAGALRRHYLEHFTPARHLTALRVALQSLSPR